MASTEESAKTPGIAYVMDVRRDEAEAILVGRSWSRAEHDTGCG
jgi:hypothetical protein